LICFDKWRTLGVTDDTEDTESGEAETFVFTLWQWLCLPCGLLQPLTLTRAWISATSVHITTESHSVTLEPFFFLSLYRIYAL